MQIKGLHAFSLSTINYSWSKVTNKLLIVIIAYFIIVYVDNKKVKLEVEKGG